MEKKLLYSEALKEIEAIITEIEDETIEVDVLTKKVKRAIELITSCKTRLRKTEEELNTILEEFSQEKTEE